MKIENILSIKRKNPSFQKWSDSLSKVPEEEQASWIFETLRGKDMLPIFGRFFFPHIIVSETAPCHHDLIEELSAPRDSAIIFPRGFAKSTWEKIDIIHDVVYRLETVILYIGNTITDAMNHFEAIRLEFENNEYLIAVYGNLVPADSQKSKKWTNVRFRTTNDVNVVARGAGKGRGVNINNRRPSKIILDDIEDDEEVRSFDRRQKLHNWIYNVIFPCRAANRSKIKFIGTVISPLAEVLAFYKGHGGIFKRAIENGESIWPAYMPIKKLEEIRDGYDDLVTGKHVDGIGTQAFQQEYMNSPSSPELSILRMDWLEPFYYNDLPPSLLPLDVIIMLDPQTGQSKTADFYSICVVGRYPNDRHRYILERKTGRDSQRNQAALLVRTYQEYSKRPNARVAFCGVEKVLTQVAVYQLFLEWQSGSIDLPDVDNHNRNAGIIPVEPQGKDKVARMQMHQPAFERGEIHLHFTDRNFAEKLVNFPNVEHDDDIDALIYCLEYANKTGNQNFWNTESEVIPGITAGLINRKF